MLLALSLIVIAGCNEPVAIAPKTFPHDVRKVLYRWDSAQKDMALYDKICTDSLGVVPIRAYTVRAVDLVGALGLDTALANSDTVFHHIRIYLGYKKDSGFRLFILPVEGANLSGPESDWTAGKDIRLDSTGHAIRHPKAEADATEYVLDLNAPCPNTCPAGTSGSQK
jgi:hypothetical protein